MLVPFELYRRRRTANSLACFALSLKRSTLSALRLRYQLQPNSAASNATIRAKPSKIVVLPSRSAKKLGSSRGGGGGGDAFLTGAGAGVTAAEGAGVATGDGAGITAAGE